MGLLQKAFLGWRQVVAYRHDAKQAEQRLRPVLRVLSKVRHGAGPPISRRHGLDGPVIVPPEMRVGRPAGRPFMRGALYPRALSPPAAGASLFPLAPSPAASPSLLFGP